MDCSLPGSSAHGILQAKTLEWVAFPFFQIQGSNPSLLHWRQILYRLSQQGSPIPGPASWQIPTGHPNACFQGRSPKVPLGNQEGPLLPIREHWMSETSNLYSMTVFPFLCICLWTFIPEATAWLPWPLRTKGPGISSTGGRSWG